MDNLGSVTSSTALQHRTLTNSSQVHLNPSCQIHLNSHQTLCQSRTDDLQLRLLKLGSPLPGKIAEFAA